MQKKKGYFFSNYYNFFMLFLCGIRKILRQNRKMKEKVIYY